MRCGWLINFLSLASPLPKGKEKKRMIKLNQLVSFRFEGELGKGILLTVKSLLFCNSPPSFSLLGKFTNIPFMLINLGLWTFRVLSISYLHLIYSFFYWLPFSCIHWVSHKMVALRAPLILVHFFFFPFD